MPAHEQQEVIAGLREELARVRAERDRLRQDVGRCELVGMATNDTVWEWDLTQHTLRWNEGIHRTFGYAAGAAGTTLEWWVDHIHPEDRARVVDGIHGAQAGRRAAWSDEYRFLRADGTYAWVMDRGYSQFDPATGAAVRMVGAMHDQTERRLAEEALRESEDRFRAMADNIPQLAWMADEHGWIFWYNQRWYDYTGTTLEEMQGWGWKKVHHPEHVDRVVKRIQVSWETGQPWEDTFPLRGKDGTYRWFLSRALPIRDDAGRRVGWFGTNTDVTEQRATEEALRMSEASFRDLADSMPQVVWRTLPDGRHDYFNQRWFDYSNTRPGETDDWGWERFLHPDDKARTDATWRHSLATGEPYEIAYRFRNGRTGEYRWFMGRALPARNAEGHIRYWYGTGTDIQAQMDTGQALQAANARLVAQAKTLQRQQIELAALGETVRARSEAALAARNTELQAANLRLAAQAKELQAQTEELRQADRYKDEFLGVISHELRTPLNFIMGFASALDDDVMGKLAPKQAEAVGKILSGADLMLRIVGDLLDMSRIQAGRFELRQRPTSFATLVGEVLGAARSVADAKGIGLTTDLAELPPVSLDGDRVMQLLDNLVGNALKFTPRGGSVRVRARLDGNAILCEVADDGIGIAPEDRDRLFTRFKQLDMGATRQAEGMGLGLAISKAIVEAHGGTIGVHGEGEGQGVTFWFRLPI